MNILGLSAYYHDSAAALVCDGEIVAAAQEERFTRKKHDQEFPAQAIECCLDAAGLTPERLDFVGFYDKPFLKFERLLETYLAYGPVGFQSFLKAMPQWLRKKLRLPREMRGRLHGLYTKRFVFTRHHESHAASAFFPSPFDEAAILTIDGVGEWATASIGYGSGHRIRLTHELQFPHSLGLLYAAFTYFCGFKVNSDEYKLMGLAPYGEPTYVDVITNTLIDLKDDGSFWMDMSYFNYCQGLTMTSEKFHRLFGGPPRSLDGPITQREMDLAASIQRVTEEIMLRMADAFPSFHPWATPNVLAPPPGLSPAVVAIIANVPLGAYVAAEALRLNSPFLQTLLVNALIFLVPGYAWVRCGRGSDPVLYLLKVLAVSTGCGLLALVALAPLPNETPLPAFVACLVVVTNLGLAWRLRHGTLRTSVPCPVGLGPTALLVLLGVLFYAQTYVGAAYRVPPLEDHDTETQGTAYGLVHHLQPTFVSNRGFVYFFAHPLLLHLYIGESVFLSGELDSLRYHHDNATWSRNRSQQIIGEVWETSYHQFQANPVLVPTRTPNIFLAAVTLPILGLLVIRRTGSLLAAAGTSLLYMTLPEIYVRSAYGGYLAITNFFLVVMAYQYLEAIGALTHGRAVDDAPRRWSFAASFLAMWSNQKVILLPLAAALHVFLGIVRRSSLSALHRTPGGRVAVALVAGVTFGWLSFAAYGLSVAPQEFFSDHVVGHLMDRFQLNDVRLMTDTAGAFVYPSILGLWLEFGRHLGVAVVVLGLISAGLALRHLERPESFLLLWFAVGAVIFSATDWRQTKHLALIVPALVLLIGFMWGNARHPWHTVLDVAVFLGVSWNVWQTAQLMADFSYLQPQPIW